MHVTIETPRGQIAIRPTDDIDVDAFIDLRLEALRTHPESFGSDYDESRRRDRGHWLDRMRTTDRQTTYVAQASDGLVGMTGIFREEGIKVRHLASIWGVYVRPAWRRIGLAGAMINACMDWARAPGDVRIVRLTVITENPSAVRCYRRCGFEQYGLAEDVIHANGKFYDEYLLAKRLMPRVRPSEQ